MIVVDTNLLSYSLIPGQYTGLAEKALRKDHCCAPLLWRSEFRNVLALYFRQRVLSFEDIQRKMTLAEQLFWGREFTVRSTTIFDCVKRSTRSAYDCEFVALAMDLGILLVTSDEPIVAEFPAIAVHLRDYVRS